MNSLLNRMFLQNLESGVSMLSVELEPEVLNLDRDDSDTSDDSDDACDLFADIADSLEKTAVDDVDMAKVGDCVMLLLDWMSKFKSTDVSADGMWQFLESVLPKENNLCTFQVVQKVMLTHKDKSVIKYDVCVNDCVAFIDSTCTELEEYKYSSLEQCPRCGADRNVMNERSEMVARKCFYYFPCKQYFRDLFNMPDLVPYLHNNLPQDAFPVGHVRNSRGWQDKVTNNLNISSDSRNQAIIVSSDGVPLFKDMHSTSVWPLVIRSANLPDGLWTDVLFCHMVGFYTCEYLTREVGTNKFGKVKRAPQSLSPLMTVFANELLHLERDGIKVHDSQTNTDFKLKVILLFMVGDYPAQAVASGFVHQGGKACHW